MAIIPKNEYAGRISTSNPNLPQGEAINIVSGVVGTGTPVEEKWINDLWGFLQEILDKAAITPSGNPDQVGNSQYFEGLEKTINKSNIRVAESNAGMIATAYDAGTVVFTKMGSTLFDGGSAIYLVATPAEYTKTPDESHDAFTLSGGNIAVLISTVPGSGAILSQSLKENNLGRENNRAIFHSGFIDFGKQGIKTSTNSPINEGLWTDTLTPYNLRMGYDNTAAVGTSSSAMATLNANGTVVDIINLNNGSDAWSNLKTSPAPTALVETTTTTVSSYKQSEYAVLGNQPYVCIADSTAGTLLTDTAFFEPRDQVSREDLLGFEVFLVPLTGVNKRPYYRGGRVQSLLSTYEGIPMSATSGLGITGVTQGYCAIYVGDTTTDGLGADFELLSQPERDTLEGVERNLYYSNGVYYQWHCRQRAVNGLGNNVWNVRTGISGDARFLSQANKYIGVQGYQSTPVSYVSDIEYTSALIDNPLKATGTGFYAARKNSGEVTEHAIDGECYFIPICTATTLSKIAYHGIINPLGTALFSDGETWEATITTNTSLAEVITNTDMSTGAITSGLSARPDGAYYDTVYEWQVNDLRNAASGYTHNVNQSMQSVIDSTKRGWSGLPILHVTAGGNKTVTVSGSSSFFTSNGGELHCTVSAADNGLGVSTKEFDGLDSELFLLQGAGNSMLLHRRDRIPESDGAWWPFSDNVLRLYGIGNVDISAEFNSNFPSGTVLSIVAISVSDVKFATLPLTAAISTIPNLVATLASYGATSMLGAELIDGVPDGVEGFWKLNRKAIETTINRVWSEDNGVNWTSGVIGLSSSANTLTSLVPPASIVQLNHYTAKAEVSTPSPQLEVTEREFSEVSAFNSANAEWGANLCAELTEFVPVNTSGQAISTGFRLYGYGYTTVSKQLIDSSFYTPTHNHIDLGGTTAGVEVVGYHHHGDDGRIYLGILSFQKVYNGGWDTDNQFIVVDGISTDIDSNGSTVVVAHHIADMGLVPKGVK